MSLVKVRHIKSGNVIERQPVDARELVEHDLGEYEYVEAPAEPKPKKNKKVAAAAVDPQREKRAHELEEMSAEEVRVLALAAGVVTKTKAGNIENILEHEYPE